MTESIQALVKEVSQRRALAAVGEFAAALSHEVRNALTSVQIDMARVDEKTENEQARALVARTLSRMRRLDAAVTGALRIARSGHIVPRDVNLSELMHDAMRTAQPSFTGSGTLLISSNIADGVVVRGDGDALLQLFLNILLNSQQALLSGGSAVVSLSAGNGHAKAAITDTGVGMTEVQLEHALDPYFTTREKGTGLGLPIARQIARAHGGDLRIRSERGVGTVVEVQLPCSSPELQSGQEAAWSGTVQEQGDRLQ
jgi:signal transduction histidine kinase